MLQLKILKNICIKLKNKEILLCFMFIKYLIKGKTTKTPSAFIIKCEIARSLLSYEDFKEQIKPVKVVPMFEPSIMHIPDKTEIDPFVAHNCAIAMVTDEDCKRPLNNIPFQVLKIILLFAYSKKYIYSILSKTTANAFFKQNKL